MKFIEKIIFGIAGLFVLWILLSWIEVILFNLEPGHIYSYFNVFTILMK